MYSYITGRIVEINPQNVIIDNHGIGYLVFVPNPYSFERIETTIYIYQHVREDAIVLYGFKQPADREMFIKLISVKGIGPKSALSILASGRVPDVSRAIEESDVSYLMKFPGIGQKASQQIILDLKGKLLMDVAQTSEMENVAEALAALGYSRKEINHVLPKLAKAEINQMIKEALKLMLK